MPEEMDRKSLKNMVSAFEAARNEGRSREFFDKTLDGIRTDPFKGVEVYAVNHEGAQGKLHVKLGARGISYIRAHSRQSTLDFVRPFSSSKTSLYDFVEDMVMCAKKDHPSYQSMSDSEKLSLPSRHIQWHHQS